MEEDVQKLTDKYIKNIDAAVEEKQKEIMSVYLPRRKKPEVPVPEEVVRGTFAERQGIAAERKQWNILKKFAEGLSIDIIMDGNGRWAKNRGLPRTAGHKKGAEVVQDIANYCEELGVSSVYFYAFSTENWKRPLEEVNAIMRLFGEYLLKGFDDKNRNIRIKFIGDRTALDETPETDEQLEADSSVKTGMTLNIAVNYGGRPEIVRAAQQLAARAAAGEIKPEEITEEMMTDAMNTAGQKDPDFILRPSGEKRLSTLCSGRRPTRSW